MGQSQVKNLMAELKLHGMLRGVDQTLFEAQSQALSATELLDVLSGLVRQRLAVNLR